MAAETKIKIRRSSVQDKAPSTTDLALGELAINTYDGKLFLKKSVNGTESIVTLEKQLTAGTGVTITSGAINIGQDVSTSVSPTFAGATLNGITSISQSGTGTQNTLKVAGASTGSVFTVGVSDTAADGINLKSLTSNLASPAKLTLSGSSVVLKAGTKELTFNNTGNIVLPANGDIVDSNNQSVLKFPVVKRVTFDNQAIDNNCCLVFNINGDTNKITAGPLSYAYRKNFQVNGMVTFFGPVHDLHKSVSGITPYQTYYIKTVDVVATAGDLGYDQPDPVTGTPSPYQTNDPLVCDITISETLGGSTFDLSTLSTEVYEEAIMLSTVSPNSFQTQRAPRQWTNYDSLETTGYDITTATFGDTYFDDVSQHIFIYVDLGDGTPQRLDFTAL